MALCVVYNEVSLSQGLTRDNTWQAHAQFIHMYCYLGRQETELLEVNSYIREYHVYKAVWEATCGDVLCLEREHNNK